jgi:hypothetical protein
LEPGLLFALLWIVKYYNGKNWIQLSTAPIGNWIDYGEEDFFFQHVLFDTGRRRTRLGIIKKRGEAEQVKMIWITPSSCAKDLTISEGTGATFLFNFHSRVPIPMCFHAISFFRGLKSKKKRNGQIPFLRNTYKKKDNGNPTINYFIFIY